MSGSPCVSLCMIVKNEEYYLGDFLASVTDAYDEMIVLDTASANLIYPQVRVVVCRRLG